MQMRAALASTRSLRLFEAKSLAEKILLVLLDKHEVCSIFVHYENLDLDHHRSNRLNALAKRRPPFGIVLSRSIHMLTIEDVVGAPAAAGVATRKSFFSSATATGHPRMPATTIVATIDPWRLCRLPYPTFWFPIIEVCDFLDGDKYPAEAEDCRSRPAAPGIFRRGVSAVDRHGRCHGGGICQGTKVWRWKE
ncbi:hypothetical protein ACTJKM_26135 [Ensifer sp. 22460]